MATPHILGDDGKVHTGKVQRRMSTTLMLTDCRTPALRPLSPGETWWHNDEHRICEQCQAAKP